MATIKLKGNPIQTNGNLPKIGDQAPDFDLINDELAHVSLNDYKGQNVILNIFPSIDTPVCAQSVRTFNKRASEKGNTKVLCVSKDLPFAQKRFCGAEGIENVQTLSDFEGKSFSDTYGVTIAEGAFKGLMARAIVAINPEGKVVYTEMVDDIVNEPNYDAVLEKF